MHNLTGESMNPHHRWNILFSVLLSRNHHNYDQYNLRSFWYLLEFLVVTTEKKRDWYLLDLILSPVKMCIRFGKSVRDFKGKIVLVVEGGNSKIN